jgi:hypothetical protein
MRCAARSRGVRAARRGGVILAVLDLDGLLRAKMRQPVPEFFNGEHGKAGRERALADREARDAETEPREPAAGSEVPLMVFKSYCGS